MLTFPNEGILITLQFPASKPECAACGQAIPAPHSPFVFPYLITLDVASTEKSELPTKTSQRLFSVTEKRAKFPLSGAKFT